MFKVTTQVVNNAPSRIRLIAQFDQPQTVEFASFTVEAAGIVLEPNGCVFLLGKKKAKGKDKKEEKIPFENEPVPLGRENPNLAYAIGYLKQEQVRLKIESVGDGKISFGKRPVSLLYAGHAYFA